MNPKTEIHESEWLKLLDEMKPKPPEGSKTSRDLAVLWNLSFAQVDRKIHILLREGKITEAGRIGTTRYYVLSASRAR